LSFSRDLKPSTYASSTSDWKHKYRWNYTLIELVIARNLQLPLTRDFKWFYFNLLEGIFRALSIACMLPSNTAAEKHQYQSIALQFEVKLLNDINKITRFFIFYFFIIFSLIFYIQNFKMTSSGTLNNISKKFIRAQGKIENEFSVNYIYIVTN
jgi:hypothetical protein